ncbi:MAG: N-6 DNA methylase, partial [Proteobacteria bacterium]|nr:N-6 DNA methylase [Pseudomonadota bacterium]
EAEPVDVVVANPPFSVDIRDGAVLERYELARRRQRVPSDWLFIEALEGWVRPGGRAAVVLPWTVLVNPSTARLRQRIDANWTREAICALPEGVFRPFGGAAGRAFLLWLKREKQPLGHKMEWAALGDPGYDVHSLHFASTNSNEVQELIEGKGWKKLNHGEWVPGVIQEGVALESWVSLRNERVNPRHESRVMGLIELKDTDKALGEVHVRQMAAEDIKSAKAVLKEGDLLVSRMRPELGNVAIAEPLGSEPVVGSPEWVVLEPRELPHFLLRAMRTKQFRAQLAITGGQTRPRTTAENVLQSKIKWPGRPLAERIDCLSADLHRQRAGLRLRLEKLEELVDAFASGDIGADELARVLDELERA